MNRITADESMCDHLRGLLDAVEVRDGEGKLLGTYTPYVSEEERAAYEHLRSTIDFEGINRRREAERGQEKPFAEVIRRLESGEFLK